jgi:hypothetical protein
MRALLDVRSAGARDLMCTRGPGLLTERARGAGVCICKVDRCMTACSGLVNRGTVRWIGRPGSIMPIPCCVTIQFACERIPRVVVTALRIRSLAALRFAFLAHVAVHAPMKDRIKISGSTALICNKRIQRDKRARAGGTRARTRTVQCLRQPAANGMMRQQLLRAQRRVEMPILHLGGRRAPG